MSTCSGATAYIDLLAVAALVLLLRVPTLPFSVIEWDETSFALAAREAMKGHLPYVTYWDVKPPGALLLPALPMMVFGASVETVRGFGIACVLSTCVLLYFVAREFAGGRVACLAAAALYAGFSVRLHGVATITEIMLAPFSTAGVLALLRAMRTESAWRLGAAMATAGLGFGVATWIKLLPAVSATAAGGACLLALLRRTGWRLGCTLFLGMIFAAALWLPMVASGLAFWRAGWIDEFLYSSFGFGSEYVQLLPSRRYLLENLARAGWALWPLLALAATAALPATRAALFGTGRAAQGTILLAWLAGEVLAAAAPLQFWPHYFLMPLPPLCVLGAVVLAAEAPRRIRVGLVHPALAALAAVLLMPLGQHTVWLARNIAMGDVPRQVAAAVAMERRPNEGLWVFNYHPVIYLLTGASLPTRFAFPPHLASQQSAMARIDPREEIRRVLDAVPRFIVLLEERPDGFATPYDPPRGTLISERLAARYILRASWRSSSPPGTVRLFELRAAEGQPEDARSNLNHKSRPPAM
jgi:4-amino-4-deoxy-L-arabinose transferase-like glycosyltransferase